MDRFSKSRSLTTLTALHRQKANLEVADSIFTYSLEKSVAV